MHTGMLMAHDPVRDQEGSPLIATREFPAAEVALEWFSADGQQRSPHPLPDTRICNCRVYAPGISPIAIRSATRPAVDMRKPDPAIVEVCYNLYTDGSHVETPEEAKRRILLLDAVRGAYASLPLP